MSSLGQTPNSGASWFDSSSGMQLFAWRCKPMHSSRPALVAGNAEGYRHLVSVLRSLEVDKTRTVALTIPVEGPPIQWAPSTLNRHPKATLRDIEEDFKTHVDQFAGFRWFRHIEFTLSEVADASCRIADEKIFVSLHRDSAREWIATVSESTFPATHGVFLSAGNPDLWLSGDWLGAE